jgi:hypothetical protein
VRVRGEGGGLEGGQQAAGFETANELLTRNEQLTPAHTHPQQVRRAQDAVLKTRPFSETLQKVLGGLIVRLKKDNFDSPLMQERPVNKVSPQCLHLVPCLFPAAHSALCCGVPRCRQRWPSVQRVVRVVGGRLGSRAHTGSAVAAA